MDNVLKHLCHNVNNCAFGQFCIFMNIIDMARVTNKLPTFKETL